MNIGEYITNTLEQRGIKKSWLADQTGINYKTLVDKLNYNRLTAEELIKISKVLNIDLEVLKHQIDEQNITIKTIRNKCEQCSCFGGNFELGYYKCNGKNMVSNIKEQYMNSLVWQQNCPGFKERENK